MTAVLFVQPLRKNRPPERSREEKERKPLFIRWLSNETCVRTRARHGAHRPDSQKNGVIISYLERRPSGVEIPQRVLLMRPQQM